MFVPYETIQLSTVEARTSAYSLKTVIGDSGVDAETGIVNANAIIGIRARAKNLRETDFFHKTPFPF